MVALAVVAIAVPALLLTLSQQIDGTRYLQDRIQAQWIAANRLAELRLVAAAKGTLQTGLITGSEEMAGRIWYWWSESEGTQVPGFFRYEVTVSDSEDGFHHAFTCIGRLRDCGASESWALGEPA
jgi:general secretion pathway protein I